MKHDETNGILSSIFSPQFSDPLGDLVQFLSMQWCPTSELCNHVLQDLALSKSENTRFFYGHFAAGKIS